jgi:HlyD family secretion protein
VFVKKRIIGVIFIVLIIAAGFWVWKNYYGRQEDKEALLLSGNVEVTEVKVGFTLAGRVVELPWEEGQVVQKGALLARLDRGEQASIIAQNRAAIQEAKSRLEELKAGSRPQEVAQAQALLKAHEAELTRLKKDYDRSEILYKNGAISASQLDMAKSAFETKSAQQKNAAESLNLIKEGPRKESIQAAESRLQQARASLATSEERLRNTEIHAPMTGIILKKNCEPGEIVGQGIPVYTIGDLTRPWIKVYVSGEKRGLVKYGQKAQVTTDTDKNKVYEATVSYIASEAEFTPKTVQTKEERVKQVFAVKVRLDNRDQELKPSMPADVRISVK